MSDLRTGYFHGRVIWQCGDRVKLCCVRTTLNNPMHFGLAVVLYLWFSNKSIYALRIYIRLLH